MYVGEPCSKLAVSVFVECPIYLTSIGRRGVAFLGWDFDRQNA